MRIGFDFDNTIVCYDESIKRLSQNLNLPNDLLRNKLSIRNYLKIMKRESEWTEFQGELYGPGMKYAILYDNFIEISTYCKINNHELYIISHRSRYPYMGKKYDLHAYAKEWILININSPEIIPNSNIFFLESLIEKFDKIKELNIEIFVDDLPEVIKNINFPASKKTFLFDPKNNYSNFINKISCWNELKFHV